MSKWIDLSKTISSHMPVYPGDPDVQISDVYTIKKDGLNLRTVTTVMHVGTHLDAPLHFIENGDDVASIAIDKVIGYANKISVTPNEYGILPTALIEKAYIGITKKHKKLLIDTGWEKCGKGADFFTGFYGFESTFFAFLKQYNIELLGTDMPSIKYNLSDQKQAHHDLLSEKVVIVESMINLDKLDDTFWLVCLPLKWIGLEASMVRAVASKKNSDFEH
ncbi:MAG: cyclase family protein [Candidatus Izemoplasmatales bacterium]|nr:cyclase family protein [Candidatus Izemoplasmatales bacterium]